MLKRFLLALCGLLLATSSFAQQDAINLSQAVVWNSPTDVASWPITTRIERLDMRPQGAANDGLEFFFSRRYNWPNYTPPGWSGPLNYTVWAGVRINGVWHVSGIIQFWSARVATGAPILANNNFAINWVYDGRWGAMAHYQPVAGEAMVFFITAGDARGNSGVTSVRERSNVVMVNLPANDSGSFTFPVTQTRKSDLLIDFGSQGLWALTDAAAYTQLHPFNPEAIAGGDFDGNGIDEVAVDFGPSWGVWIRWNGSSWSPLHNQSPSGFITADLDGNGRDELIIDFPSGGLWAFANGNTWWRLLDYNVSKMAAGTFDGGGDELVVDIPGLGVWLRHSSGGWFQLNQSNTNDITVADFDGSGVDDVAIAFPGAGVWLLRNGATWSQLNPADAQLLASGNIDGNSSKDLVVDFGAAGVWLLRSLATWMQLNPATAEQIVVADLDGTGKDEVVIDFGNSAGGVWVWANDATWVQPTAQSPESVAAAQLN